MKIAIGADHAGYEFKEKLKKYLLNNNFEVKDFGAYKFDSEDGFPDFSIPVAKSVADNECERGVLICGSGIGVSIAANKIKGIRAVNCTCEDFAKLSRQHNDSNVICFGARFISLEDAEKFFEVWINTEFLGGKYKDRNDKLDVIK